jgi:hypothetical protein
LRQSLLLTSSIFPSSHTRWKFWTIRRDLVLGGAFDVAAITGFFVRRYIIRFLVGKENARIYIGCWNCFFRFSFKCLNLLCCLSSQRKNYSAEKIRWQQKNNKNQRKVMPYIFSSVSFHEFSKFFSLLCVVIKYIKVKLRRTHIKMKISNIVLLRCPNIP